MPALTVEQAPSYPENLARYPLGAQIEVTPKGDASAEAALLAGDPTAGYDLPNGTTSVLVSLGKVENIDSVSFLQQNTKGRVTIATSNAKLPADSPQWNTIAEQDLTSDSVKVKIGPSEAKYLRLTFNVTEPGRIADLGVYSTPTVSAFTMPRARKTASDSLAMVSYKVSDLHAKARAVYVSSGEDVKQANNMIDDQPGTVYNFAPPDAAPTAVVDLGKATKLRRISALYSPGRGKLDFYVLQSLPGGPQAASAKSLQLDEASMAGMQQVGSVNDEGSGRAAVDFPETTGRYILLKWTPAEPSAPFSVAEIAAFGGEKRENLVAANTPAEGPGHDTMAGDGKTVLDGKDFKDMADAKDIPEEGPAEGPGSALPPPPPFVFTPVVAPASP
ncbi:MAG TPA: hypothetical protein VJ719_14195 [Chthoniobacterales bacterium]|nr:hypothetical protein [Chthoniobacterales bacterium]